MAGAIAGGVILIGAVILSEIIDGADDPADKAKSDAEKAEQCKEDPEGGHKKGARESTRGKQ